MNERIKLLFEQAHIQPPATRSGQFAFTPPKTFSPEKFAELIVRECTAALFDESERLFGLYSEEADMQQAERYELCSEQCTDNIALIEKHFGVE